VNSYARGFSESLAESWIIKSPGTDAAIKTEMGRKNIFVASSVAMRRQAILDVGGYCDVFRYAQDYELYLRLARAGKRFACIREVLVDRHYSKTSITVSKRKTQALYSFAARLIHAAETGGLQDAVAPIMRYLFIFIVPNSLRKLRRGLGRGR
jgi:GT2 family glycosyltransferase